MNKLHSGDLKATLGTMSRCLRDFISDSLKEDLELSFLDRYGFRGFYDRAHKPVVLTRRYVEGLQLQGGTILGTSR